MFILVLGRNGLLLEGTCTSIPLFNTFMIDD